MAQTKPEYATVNDFRKMAIELCKKFPDKLDGIDPSLITCVAVTNKDPKDGDKDKYEIKPVPYPLRLDNPFDFYVIVNLKVWESFNEALRAALVMKALSRISKEGDGKVVPYNLNDNEELVKTFGVGYLDNPNIPNLLKDKIDWKE